MYNTLARKKEPLKSLDDKKLNMFVCGQTVYDDAHLGHAKNYINFDVIVRWLRHSGYTVKYIQNITDVDDKIIKRAKEKGVSAEQLAREYEKRFFEDMERIGVKQDVDMYPRSHDYIDTIREQIQLLFDKGYAYKLGGDIYYDVAKFKDYTKLSGMKLEELEKHRIEPKEGKKNVYDFSLWKAAKPGEPSWKINLKINGKQTELNGRPGWHIEDTAITYKIFGPQYDIHGGASELIFPHHSNEIAQAEAAFGKVPFVRYWLHVGVLNIRGEKMSKSLKNFITIREVLEKYKSEALRLFFCSTHYRKEINYTDEMMLDAEKRLGYMYEALSVFQNMKEAHESNKRVEELVSNLEKEFTEAMDNDFNTPLALSKLSITLNELRNVASQNQTISKVAKEQALNRILALSKVFGILQGERKQGLSQEIEKLISEREQARKDKDFKKSDEIRKVLREKYKVVLEDTKDGVQWHHI